MALRLSRGAVKERDAASDAPSSGTPAQDTPAVRGQIDDRVGKHKSRRRVTTAAPEEPQPVGPRSRTSVLATLALVTGLTAALASLSGLLAGPAIALGVLAVFLGVGGVAATGRRHVAGKGPALFGLVLGLGAAVLGVLALAHLISWLDPDVNTVERARDWLASYVPWLFLSR